MHGLFPRSIQARLIFSHLLVSLISLTLISAYASHILYTSVRRQVERHYEDLIFVVANQMEGILAAYQAGSTGSDQVARAIEHIFPDSEEAQFTVYLPDGVPLVDRSGSLPPPATQETAPELWDALNGPTGEGKYFRKDEGGGESLYLAVRIEQNQQALGVLRIVVPLDTALSPTRSSLGLLVVSALIVGLGMSVVGFFLARSIANPILSVTRAAESLVSSNMQARLEPPTGPHEVYRMAEAFNNMALRLQTHVDELHSFVANASHELRTPLTSIKLRVEALRNGALDDPPVTERFLAEIEGEVDRLSYLVNDLLDLSRIETGLDPTQRIPMDLAAIANDVFASFRVRAERAEIRMESAIRSGLPPVSGNEEQLRRMLYNLVDNAIKYTSVGGNVKIFLDEDREGWVVLKVSDTGFGIAPGHLPHIFERFYRVEATRPRYGPSHGSGLGLPIAKSIAEAHGGEIGVSSQVGSGTTFWVKLPTI